MKLIYTKSPPPRLVGESSGRERCKGGPWTGKHTAGTHMRSLLSIFLHNRRWFISRDGWGNTCAAALEVACWAMLSHVAQLEFAFFREQETLSTLRCTSVRYTRGSPLRFIRRVPTAAPSRHRHPGSMSLQTGGTTRRISDAPCAELYTASLKCECRTLPNPCAAQLSWAIGAHWTARLHHLIVIRPL